MPVISSPVFLAWCELIGGRRGYSRRPGGIAEAQLSQTSNDWGVIHAEISVSGFHRCRNRIPTGSHHAGAGRDRISLVRPIQWRIVGRPKLRLLHPRAVPCDGQRHRWLLRAKPFLPRVGQRHFTDQAQTSVLTPLKIAERHHAASVRMPLARMLPRVLRVVPTG